MRDSTVGNVTRFLRRVVFGNAARLPYNRFRQHVRTQKTVAGTTADRSCARCCVAATPRSFTTLTPLRVRLIVGPHLDTRSFRQRHPIVLRRVHHSSSAPHHHACTHAVRLAFRHLPCHHPILKPTTIVRGLSIRRVQSFRNA